MAGNSSGTAKKAHKPKKPVAKPEGERYPRKAVQIPVEQDDDDAVIAWRTTAVMMSPELAAFRVIRGAEQKSGNWDSIDVPTLMEQLRVQAAAVNRGDLEQAEAMLMNQATALQSLFARLAERGMSCDQIPGFEANMRMALRAQSQCRATLETLATIKNPPVVFAKQANISHGHQQVNNGVANSDTSTHAREKREIPQTKLMEAHNDEWLDTGAAGATSGSDKAMATVGEINGAENG